MSGGASTNAKQTNIKFTPMSKDKPQEPQIDTAETSINDNERTKRGRFEMENNDDTTGTNLRVPAPATSITPSGSKQSLFDRDSIATIIGTEQQQPPNTTPRETNEFTNVDEGDLRPRLIRLERLKDKADR